MEFLWFLLIGLAAGYLANRIMKSSNGLPSDLIVGVVGAILGGWLFGVLRLAVSTGLIGQLLVAVVGACLLIAGLRLIKVKG